MMWKQNRAGCIKSKIVQNRAKSYKIIQSHTKSCRPNKKRQLLISRRIIFAYVIYLFRHFGTIRRIERGCQVPCQNQKYLGFSSHQKRFNALACSDVKRCSLHLFLTSLGGLAPLFL